MIKALRDLFSDPERVSKLCMALAIILGLGSVVVLAGAFIFM